MSPPPYAAPSVVPGDAYNPGEPPLAQDLAFTGVSSASLLLLVAVVLIAAGVALYVVTKARPRV
jgi:hypothetical protein